MESFTFEGENGFIANFERVGNNRYLTIPTEAAVRIFKAIAIMYPDIAGNQMGLYSFASIGRNRKAKFMSISTPSFLLKPRSKGCTWNPQNGRIKTNLTEIALCPVEYQGEECPDSVIGDCLEGILGVGNQIHDMNATPEGRQLMRLLMESIYQGLGNSFYSLAWYGQHPIIDESDENDWFTLPRDEWADYKRNQSACVGFMTLLDHYKDVVGLPNLNVDISESDVDGDKYIGDGLALIDRVISGAKGQFSQMLRQKAALGQNPIIQVTNGVFDRIKDQLSTPLNGIPASYNFYITGVQSVQNCPNGDCVQVANNAIVYRGYTIYNNPVLSIFDDITGVISHRVIMSARGVFGLAYDVPELNQFNGMGLQVVQKLDAPDMGKTYMHTTFEVGTAILDTEYVTMASLILSPN